ncbi:MAG: hypothetical protein KC516_00545 [Nanoarchaeota archaeon]|nr:hypothetical protein [Nanoarchaeota archaeon]
MATILQYPILTDFLYPFLLIFFIVFAILQKTKILGDGRAQLDAFVSLVVGLIFVSAVFPKIVVGNLILFLAVGLVVLFVGLMLWGFINGGNATISGGMKKFLAVILFIAVVFALIAITGFGGGLENLFTTIFDFLFVSKWSGTLWTNVIIIALIIGAILVVVKTKTASS